MPNNLLIKRAIPSFFLLVNLICASLVTYAQRVPAKRTPVVLAPPDTSQSSLPVPGSAQDTNRIEGVDYLTIKNCIDYAMVHQPALNIAMININIAKTINAINLAGLLPQVSSSGTLTHYLQRSNASTITNSSTGIINNGSGISNTFVPQLAVSQAIFSPNLLLAVRSAPFYVTQARQATDSTKIFLVSAVSKSFYSVLLTLEQINVLKEDTARLGKNVRDTYHQYRGGIVDETDYEEATITLNNSKAQLKQANENVAPRYAELKQLMGYPAEKQFNVSFDTLQMIRDISIDTAQQLQFEKRIEYQSLLTSKNIQNELVHYYSYSFLPSISAVYNYNLAFESSKFSGVFNNSYPSSIIGLSFTVPIFTGFARLNSLHRARLQQQQLDYTGQGLKLQIYTEYTTALANYKSNLYNLKLLQKNVALAKRVYFVVNLQYKQGIVAYLNVITAESNLITAEISYLNALFQVLSNKIDLQKAMGNITY